MNKDKKINESVAAIVEPLAEAVLDLEIPEGFIKDIPILGTAVNIVRLKDSISDRLLLSKLKSFIESTRSVSDSQRLHFNQAMMDTKESARITRMLLQYINHHDSEEKSKLLGYVFAEFIKQNIDEIMFKRLASLIGAIHSDTLKQFVVQDGKFDWLDAHDYIAHGLAMFEVPRTVTLDDIGEITDVDQTGMKYGANPWGAEVIKILKPYFND